MFNTTAKLEFGIAAAALAFAIGLRVAVDEPAGFFILFGIFVAAFLAGLALGGSRLVDRAPRYGPDGPPVGMVTIDRSLVTRPSPWPALTAVAVGILAVGVAVGSDVVTAGVIAVLLVTAGWFAQSWREDPSFTPREGAKIGDRLIAPLGLPLLALGLVAVIVISVSRVLLAVPKDASVAVAGGLAVLLLVAFFVLASRPVERGVFIFLSGLAVTSVVVAGGVSAAAGYRTFDHPAAAAQTTTAQVAQNVQYKLKEITVTAGQNARISFANLDSGVYHNIAVYTQRSGGEPVWTGEPIRGVKRILYQHVFTQAGTYSFRCDFHPTTMIGTFTVQGGP